MGIVKPPNKMIENLCESRYINYTASNYKPLNP